MKLDIPPYLAFTTPHIYPLARRLPAPPSYNLKRQTQRSRKGSALSSLFALAVPAKATTTKGQFGRYSIKYLAGINVSYLLVRPLMLAKALERLGLAA